MALPVSFAIKAVHNKKYLQFITENFIDGVQMHGLHSFSSEEAVTPITKFAMEPAKQGGGLIHLKCCYNNKYFMRWGPTHYWIAAAANEPEEDKTKWNCTLFKPVINAEAKTIQFVHVQLGYYIGPSHRAGKPFTGCLFADSDMGEYTYTITDWDSLFVLPKNVAFKSGTIGTYLSGQQKDGKPYLLFVSDKIDDPTIANEVSIAPDGSVFVKSKHLGGFWRNNDDWILANADAKNNETPNALFWPLRLTGNAKLALRSIANNKYCKRYTTRAIMHGFSANISTLDDPETVLEVAELVISREIFDVKYQFLDARPYGQKAVTLATQTVNNTNKESSIVVIEFAYRNTEQSTWNSTVSSKVFSTVTMKAGLPVIVGGFIDNSTTFGDKYEWGKVKDFTSEFKLVSSFVVQRLTKLTVNLVATLGSYDIPFSYSQRDTLVNGEKVVSQMNDGIYTRTNVFSLKYETKEEPAKAA